MPDIPDSGDHDERRRIQTGLPIYPVGRDDWQETATDTAVAGVLRAIREHYGTSPTFEVRESDPDSRATTRRGQAKPRRH